MCNQVLSYKNQRPTLPRRSKPAIEMLGKDQEDGRNGRVAQSMQSKNKRWFPLLIDYAYRVTTQVLFCVRS